AAAMRSPRIKGNLTVDIPPAGGCMAVATIALTIGAPAKTIAITTAGDPFAPKASSTQNAPIAPTIPATSDHAIPGTGMLQDALLAIIMNSGASTAVRK